MGIATWLLLSFLWKSPRPTHDDLEMAETSGRKPANETNDDIANQLTPQFEDDDQDIDEDSSEPFDSQESEISTKKRWYSRLKAFIFPSSDVRDKSFIPNYRLLPILSGILMPFSILLDIPGLTEPWFIRTVDNKTVQTKPDTAILLVGLGISMFCIILANICVFLRLLEKGNITLSTITSIVALSVHDVINVTVIIIFSVQHRNNKGFTFGASYWSTVCSTTTSIISNVTIVWDFLSTPNFGRSGSGLTRKQRSLVIIIMMMLIYIGFGALVNSFLLKLDFINSLYYTVVCIETVGFGDIVPDSTGSRIFICAYIGIGVVCLGVAVSLCRDTVFEQLEVDYRIRLTDIRKARKEHKKWRRWERSWRQAVAWRLRDMGVSEWIHDDESDDYARYGTESSSRVNPFRRFASRLLCWKGHDHNLAFRCHGQVRGFAYGHPGTHLNVEAMSSAQLEAAAIEAGVPLEAFYDFRQQHKRSQSAESDDASTSRAYQFFWRPLSAFHEPVSPIQAEINRMSGMLTRFALATSRVGMEPRRADGYRQHESHDVDSTPMPTNNVPWMLSARSQTESVQGIKPSQVLSNNATPSIESRERKAFWTKFIFAWSLFFAFWMAGAGIFSAAEGWSFTIGMYFCFTTFTTTGFGDFTPTTPAARAIFVLWALFGLATITLLISLLQDAFSSRYKNVLRSSAFQRAMKRYRNRIKRGPFNKPVPFTRQPPSSTDIDVGNAAAVKECKDKAQKQLEKLPEHVLRHSRTFYKHVQYLMHKKSGLEYSEGRGQEDSGVHLELTRMLDEIARALNMEERVKAEIMEDEEARDALSILSMEKALREMIEDAERSLASIAERDRLEAGLRNEKGDSEMRSRAGTIVGASTEDTPGQIPPTVDDT